MAAWHGLGMNFDTWQWWEDDSNFGMAWNICFHDGQSLFGHLGGPGRHLTFACLCILPCILLKMHFPQLPSIMASSVYHLCDMTSF